MVTRRKKHDLPLVPLAIVLGVSLVTAIVLLRPETAPIAPTPAPALSERIRIGAEPVPAYSDAIGEDLASFPAFDVIVSYTDRGFEPQRAAVRAGSVVRFVNNSSAPFWVAADGSEASAYPPVRGGCAASALDSCRPLDPLEYWSFRFDEAGTWHLYDNLRKSNGMVMEVE